MHFSRLVPGRRLRRFAALCVAFAWFVLVPLTPAVAAPAKDFHVGVDGNYSLGMETEGRAWRWGDAPEDLFSGMARQGVRDFRVRLWTGDTGVNGKAYATDVVKRALRAGLDPYLVIFLSEDWADMVKQPAPAIWKDLALPERAAAIRTYSRDIVQHFRREGLRSHLYEIGNEIDYGICGVYPGKGTKKSVANLSRDLWPKAAQLIRASQEGVLAADPEARFLLHIAHWWDPAFCEGFFQFMLGNGVRVDYAGLSYFPSSNIGGSLEFEQFGQVVSRLHAAVRRPVIVPELAYPSTADFKGQFSRWKKAAPGYPLTPEGQRRWLADFLRFAAAHPAIERVFYWSPEWCGEGMWKAFALFDVDGRARPAWSAFAPAGPGSVVGPLPTSVFYEVAEGGVFPVPRAAALAKAQVELANALRRHGRVNTDFIATITNAAIVVDGYRLVLRAALSGNLSLLRDTAPGAEGTTTSWQRRIDALDPRRERLVLFQRGAASTETIAAYARARGLDVLVHPVAAEAPLVFGLGLGWQGGEAVADGGVEPAEAH